MSTRTPFRLDLLRSGSVRALVRSPWLPLVLQVAALTGVLALILNGWGVGQDVGAAELKTLRKLNLTTLAVWGLWWPGMLVVTLLFGRVWCTVCPLELVHRLSRAFRRLLPGRTWPLPRFMRQGWVVLAAYLVLQILVAGFSLHRVPHLTSLMLVLLVGVAVITGLVFKDPHAFCTGACPAAALLGAYGRLSPVQLGTHDPEVCETCDGKPCTAPANRERLDARSCPSLLRPYKREVGDACTLCLQCVKVCPHDNLGLGLGVRWPVARLNAGETGFVLVAAGFVLHELAGEAPAIEALFHAVPEVVAEAVPGLSFAWAEASWFLVAVPAVVWGLALGIARLLGHRAELGLALRDLAMGALPVLAMAHAAKALAKLGSWGPWLPMTLTEPRGTAHFAQFLEGSLVSPERLYTPAVLAVPMLLLMGAAVWTWHRRGSDTGQRVGRVVAGVVLGGALVGWLVA